jgi:hypothetical protein
MLEGLKTRQFKISLIVAAGLVVLYAILFGPLSSQTVGGKDWVDAFRSGARGDYSQVVTPYWSLFLSYLPSRLPEPFGYFIWITVGTFLVMVTASYFKSPLLLVLLSYPMNWALFYGQVDPYVIFGVGLGYFAVKHSKPLLIGIAISLLLIKPQFGILLAIYYFFSSPSKWKTLLISTIPVLLSLLAWPGWLERLLFEQLTAFMDQPPQAYTNTSLGLPLWAGMILSVLVLILPLRCRDKVPVLLATNLLVSPYSTIYSQLSLLSLGLPKGFYLWGFIPWIVAILSGPFGNWRWAFLFPLSVVIYYYLMAVKGRKFSEEIAVLWNKMKAGKSQ